VRRPRRRTLAVRIPEACEAEQVGFERPTSISPEALSTELGTCRPAMMALTKALW